MARSLHFGRDNRGTKYSGHSGQTTIIPVWSNLLASFYGKGDSICRVERVCCYRESRCTELSGHMNSRYLCEIYCSPIIFGASAHELCSI